ncbi:hypothetical protein [Paenibacillus aceris]|uniref:Uncharacterized protein n=1 Tax=Paenibacillus aceris TaxID=869555 RepID=A0ABS4HU62_9BACL|nr:hypothetical protein [Paenibacillus aceris]MBP1961791.1 hypothetical protein [Paenibacillus aceris]NHW34352.1 hypothetical protein [Paenibacillus aceris]
MGKEYRKTVPLGLQKKSVDLFLKKLHALQEKELQELREQVNNASRENVQLSAQLKILRDRQRQNRTKDLLEHAVQKTDETDSNVNLNPLAEVTFVKPTLKVISLPNRESVDKVIVDEGEIEEDKDEVEEVEVEEKVEVEVEAPSASEERISAINYTPTLKDREVERTSSGFWGETDHYFEDEFLLEYDDSVSSAVLSTTSPLPKSQPEKSTLVPNESNYKEEIAAGSQATEEAASFEENIADEPENSEIGMIKQNYIVGKLAGENLIDRQGRLIVAKQAVITEDVIRRAQREGKLAELIVNMTIPGLGE